jgi:hypothetical protein
MSRAPRSTVVRQAEGMASGRTVLHLQRVPVPQFITPAPAAFADLFVLDEGSRLSLLDVTAVAASAESSRAVRHRATAEGGVPCSE